MFYWYSHYVNCYGKYWVEFIREIREIREFVWMLELSMLIYPCMKNATWYGDLKKTFSIFIYF